jgi:ACS family tartrate transporter-like MFS transporter
MRFLLGVAEAAFFPGIITYLNHWYCRADRAKAVALFMAAIPVSQVIAAPVSAALMRVHWLGLAGWRWLLLLEGAPAVVCGFASWLYLTDHPREALWLAPEERTWLARALADENREHADAGRTSWFHGLRHPHVLLLCAVYFGGTTGNYGVNLWMPKMLQRLGNLSATRTSLLSMIPPLISVPAMLACGWHSDGTGERRWHTALPRFAAGVALAAIALHGVGLPAALVLFTVASAGIVAAYPPFWAIPGNFLGATAAAASIGLINSIGNLGGFAGPYVIGWLSSRTGSFEGGLWSVGGVLFLSGGLALLVRKRRGSGGS